MRGTTDRSIADRYHVIARIASGGMGEVFRARDTVLQRIVAVKVLPESLASKPGFVERFRAEAQAAASLSHPNVVAVHDWGDTGSLSYMVMEYVRGRNLREILASYGVLAPRQACEVTVQALRALHAAHERGLVHRDVKPENILVTLDGVVKVADFGLARAAEAASTTDGLVGTVAYVAPEQLQRATVDGRTDVYAMGCVLYELLTGSQPYEGDPAGVIAQHLHGEMPRPSDAQPAVTPELDRIVSTATAKVPADRYGSAAQMLAAVEAAVGPLPAAPPLSELTQELTSEVAPETQETLVPGTRRRRRGRRVLTVLLVLALLGVAGFLLRPVRVPDVVGDDVDRARSVVLRSGLAPDIRYEDDTEPAGTVIDMNPDPGRWVRNGRKVRVDVSRGPQLAPVPRLVGLPQEQAGTVAQAAGFPMAVSRAQPSLRPAGEVLTQDRAEGDQLVRGTAINVTVSSGPEPVDVPDLRGKPLLEAQQVLQALGVTASATEVFHPDAASGVVVAMVPRGPTQVYKGSSVELTVSKGPEPFAVPGYVGQPCAGAKADLESKGVAVKVDGGTCGQGKVLDQYPPEGVAVKKGDSATLYVP